jgi:hypothetical protein
MGNALESLDAKISSVLAEWSLTTTLLALTIVAFLLYPIIYPDEPDTHPLLLARQATASPVRQKGESAVYRSPEVPHGYPLKTGLNVKDASAPRWAAGKDGDIRDIWREVQRGGSTGPDGNEIPKGMIMSVYGKERPVEHDIDELSKEIGTMGKHFNDAGVTKLAIYLPNSVEYLSAVFGRSVFHIDTATYLLICFGSHRFLRDHAYCAALQLTTSKGVRIAQRYGRRWSRLCGRQLAS